MKDNNQQQSLKQIMDFRIKKLNDIKSDGYDPYPSNYKKYKNLSKVIDNKVKLLDKNITVVGRIVSLRKMGKVTFVHIQENQVKLQMFVKKNNLKNDLYDKIVKRLDLGDIIGVRGKLFYTKTKELSINSTDLTLLAKSIRPLPNLKEKDGNTFFTFDDKEQRYRKRYLDLIVNHSVKKTFVDRSKIINHIRNYLEINKYIEVETPILQPIYGGANAKPFKTYHNSLNQNLYLRIADELYLKRLIIGGFEKVYEISKNFRNEGMDKNHNPEFTMLEFYSSYSDLNDMIIFTEKLINYTSQKMNILNGVNFNNKKIYINKQFGIFDFYEILNKKSKKIFQNMKNKEIYDLLINNKISIDKNCSKGKLLDKSFSYFVESELIQPTFIVNYPIELSPLAKKVENDNTLAQRFELFIGGMEIANAFSELNDPIDQRERLESQAKLRKSGDEEAQMLDEDFLIAMEHGMPPTGGVGIGIDRLVMLLTSNTSIKDVILFPAMKIDE